MEIKVFKGLNQRLIVNGLYENYFIYVVVSCVLSIMLILLVYELLPIGYWLFLVGVGFIGNGIFYLYLRRKTNQGLTKTFSTKDSRVYNRDI